ncbi:hypothetical protein HRbin29_02101 [bacterium HR29]|nr:hypothetical protein HRbin29_02101 [bacterium HR29]
MNWHTEPAAPVLRLAERVLRVSALAFAGLVVAASCGQPDADRPRTPTPEAATPLPTPSEANPFGVMLPSTLVRSGRGLEVARALGARYLRPASVFAEEWDGTCPECEAARAAGFELVLTVRNEGPGPTTPPGDLDAYERTVRDIVRTLRPALLVVENEENSSLFYAGSPEAYAEQLRAACRAAHEEGVPCTNGGLVSSLVALLVYEALKEGGGAAEAEDFARRALGDQVRGRLDSPEARVQLAKGKQLLASYRAAGADFVNFHWYIADAKALRQAVDYLERVSGLPAVTNEIGQVVDDPGVTMGLMEAVAEARLPVAVWFGLDGPRARGLVEPDGTLRPSGIAFQRFIAERYRGR